MAELLNVTVHLGQRNLGVQLVFRSRLLRWLPIGGLVLSRRRIRFKRSRQEIPLYLVGHEMVHIAQAHRMGWRYLPAYLWGWIAAGFRHDHHRMEREADVGSRAWVTNGRPWDGSAYPVPRTWRPRPFSLGTPPQDGA